MDTQTADLNVRLMDYSYCIIFRQQNEQRIVYSDYKNRKRECDTHTHTHTVYDFVCHKNENCLRAKISDALNRTQ